MTPRTTIKARALRVIKIDLPHPIMILKNENANSEKRRIYSNMHSPAGSGFQSARKRNEESWRKYVWQTQAEISPLTADRA